MEILTKLNLYIIALASLICVQSCDSPDAADCFQAAGNPSRIILQDIPEFASLTIEDNINLTIVEDDSTYLELDFYDNLIPEITLQSEEQTLYISNNNSCNFVRDYKSPHIIFHSNLAVNKITTYSSGNITNENQLLKPITIIARDISGFVKLSCDNSNITLNSNSITNFEIDGSTENLSLTAYFSDGIFDCSNLVSSNVKVLHRGFNDFRINVLNSLNGSIENAGRVIYSGNPDQVNVEVAGGGELIHIDEWN